MKDNVYAPFYQVKCAGVVTLNTNDRKFADNAFSEHNTAPKQLWQINADGQSKLLLQNLN